MDTLLILHNGLARACITFSAIAGLWCLARYFFKQGVDSNTWGVLACAEILYVGQAAVGGWMLLQGVTPQRGVHFLYDFLLMLCVPAAYAYTRGRDTRRELLMYGLLGLFLAGISIRAIITATGGGG